jgi:hypothetical protein
MNEAALLQMTDELDDAGGLMEFLVDLLLGLQSSIWNLVFLNE